MNVAEAAKELEIGTSLVYKLCEYGKLGYSRVGFGRGRIRISPAQVAEYRRSCEVPPVPEWDDPTPVARRGRAIGIPDVIGEYLRAQEAKRAERAANLKAKAEKAAAHAKEKASKSSWRAELNKMRGK